MQRTSAVCIISFLVCVEGLKLNSPKNTSISEVDFHKFDDGFDSMQRQYRRYELENWDKQIYGTQAAPETSAGIKKKNHRIVLHHIWKTGGSHLCQLAAKAGFAVPHNPGCHRWKDEAAPISKELNSSSRDMEWQPCAISPGMHKLSFDALGHECGIDSRHIGIVQKEGFSLVGMIRDPIEQAASWYMHSKTNHFGGTDFHNIKAWIKGCNKEHPCGWYTFIDNLQTRWLAGGELNVEEALANLARFDVVLEQRGTVVQGLPRLEKLDWKQPDTNSNHTSGAMAYLQDTMPAEELQYLKDMQKFDIQLIHMARSRGLISQEPGFSGF